MNSINNDNTILPIFSSNNNRNILIKTLVENNSSINQIDSYVESYVSQGNYEITKHLVERGANLNIRNNNNDTEIKLYIIQYSIFFNTGNDDKDKSNSDAINKYSNYIRCITFKIHVTIKVQNFSISQL
ncbi:hypothetical protein U3516DRAFT_745048 [Neocallimastix sp. 'constans']